MSQSSPVKIYVLGDGSLLDEGIGNMLNLDPQLNVTRILSIDDARLRELAYLEHPYTILINKSGEHDIAWVIRLIFSVPSAFARRVIVVHGRTSRLDVYDGSTAQAPAVVGPRKSIVVRTKEEFINLALGAS